MMLTQTTVTQVRAFKFITPLFFASALALFGMLMSTDSMAQTEADVLAKLKNGGKLVCKPTEPNFCLNVHVSCAGKTNYQAFAFGLETNASKVKLTVANELDQFSELYASANVDWSADNSYMFISPAKGKGYVKMFQNGKYVFRYYPPNQEGIMSLGMCE